MYGPGGATLAEGGAIAWTPPVVEEMLSSTWRWFMSLPWVVAPGAISTARAIASDVPIVNGEPHLMARGAEVIEGRAPAKRYGGE